MAGGGAGGDAPDAQATALGLPYGQPQPHPSVSPNHGIQQITVEFSEKSRFFRRDRPVWCHTEIRDRSSRSGPVRSCQFANSAIRLSVAGSSQRGGSAHDLTPLVWRGA